MAVVGEGCVSCRAQAVPEKAVKVEDSGHLEMGKTFQLNRETSEDREATGTQSGREITSGREPGSTCLVSLFIPDTCG